MALLDAGTAAVFFFARPVVSAALGRLLLTEQLGPGFFLGGALTFASVVSMLPARSGSQLVYNMPTMSGWGCSEEANECCQRLRKRCDPGQPGCVLYGAVRFLDPAKNKPRRRPDGGKLPMPGYSVSQEDGDQDGW